MTTNTNPAKAAEMVSKTASKGAEINMVKTQTAERLGNVMPKITKGAAELVGKAAPGVLEVAMWAGAAYIGLLGMKMIVTGAPPWEKKEIIPT